MNTEPARGETTETKSEPEIETEVCAEAAWSPLTAWTSITQAPTGSEACTAYWPEYVPGVAVGDSEICPPVGLVAVTAAPETGLPAKVTAAVMVAASPRLKTAPEPGPEIATERVWALADWASATVTPERSSRERTASESLREVMNMNSWSRFIIRALQELEYGKSLKKRRGNGDNLR